METSRFSIFEASKNAYLFVVREWRYLLTAGALPLIVQALTSFFLQFQRQDASNIEAYLWGMPAAAFFAWFMFLEIRLLVLGERLDRLPQDPSFLAERRNAMTAAVITALLFNMAMSAIVMTLMEMMKLEDWGRSWPLTMAGLLLSAGAFWGLRFGVLPILASVHFPLRPFLRQVRGPMFSLRLLGLGLVALFPVAFVFQMFLATIIGKPPAGGMPVELTAGQQLAVTMAGAPLSLAISMVLNAASAYALRQILGKRRDGVLA